MTDEEWEAWEQAHWYDEQRRVDRVRVLGYAYFVAGEVTKACEALQKAVDSLERAKRKAEKALEYRDMVLSHAEQVAHVATTGDEDRYAEVATCLESLVG